MTKKTLTADELMDGIGTLAETIRAQVIKDILGDLDGFMEAGPIEGDEDTWDGGYRAAIECIRANYIV